MGSGVDSASNRNEYQEDFLGGKGDQCVRLTTLPPSFSVVMKSGNLNFLEPPGPLQACNGTDLPFTRSPERQRLIFLLMFHKTAHFCSTSVCRVLPCSSLVKVLMLPTIYRIWLLQISRTCVYPELDMQGVYKLNDRLYARSYLEFFKSK